MTADELAAFVAEIRAEADARLAILRAVDREFAAPRAARWEYDHALAAWTEMLALTDADTHALHCAACEEAGRELTPADMRGLLGLH